MLAETRFFGKLKINMEEVGSDTVGLLNDITKSLHEAGKEVFYLVSTLSNAEVLSKVVKKGYETVKQDPKEAGLFILSTLTSYDIYKLGLTSENQVYGAGLIFVGLVLDGGTKVFKTAKDAKAAAEAIKEVAKEANNARKMGKDARVLCATVISWAMILNIACLIRDRIRLQNEADCIVLSLATYKARVLNFLGGTNYLIGEVLSLGINPRITQLVSYSTDMIGGFPATMKPSFESPLSDLKHETFGHKNDEGVRKIKYIIDTIQKVQDLAIKSYYAYHYSILSSNIFKDYNVLLFTSRPEKNLGLKRNSKGINYYSTINLACIYLDASMHFHVLSRNKYKQSKYSWFVEGEKFYGQKSKSCSLQKNREKKTYIFKISRNTLSSSNGFFLLLLHTM
jgi:hypothetical protein